MTTVLVVDISELPGLIADKVAVCPECEAVSDGLAELAACPECGAAPVVRITEAVAMGYVDCRTHDAEDALYLRIIVWDALERIFS